jgi:hypothetical protein
MAFDRLGRHLVGELRDRVEREGPDALEDFRVAALALVSTRLDEWEARWRGGALAAAEG